MTIICKNCNQHFEGHYCNNCGQSAKTKRLNFNDLFKKLKDIIFKNLHEGILYTSKQLFTRPGNTIREYIEGKRVKHFEPISLLITLATIYGVLYHTFHINPFKYTSGVDPMFDNVDSLSINDWIGSHFSLATCLLLPIYSLGSFIAFRKQGYNYVEHFYLNTFLASQRLLVRITFFPLLVIYNGTPQLQNTLNSLIILDIILMTWGYNQFFNKVKIIKALPLTLLSYLIFFICLSFCIVVTLFFLKRLV